MFHRFPNWWRTLAVVLLSLSAVTWPSASWATATPSFTLVHQDTSATLGTRGTARFVVTAASPTSAILQVAIFPHLVVRGDIAAIVNGRGVSGRPTAVTTLSSPRCPTSGHPLTVTITSGSTRVAVQCRQPVLPLSCLASSCDGVYPLRYQVQLNGQTHTTWSMLAIKFNTVVVPLHVVVLAQVGPNAWLRAPSATATMVAMAKYPLVPLAVGVDYRPLLDALVTTNVAATSWRRALTGLLASPFHQAISAPPATIDFGGLVTNGLVPQVTSQLHLGATLLAALTKHSTSDIVWDQGTSSVADLNALHQAGIAHVVIDENAMRPVPSTTLAWGQPERPVGTSDVTSLATDSQLSTIANNQSITPELRSILVTDSLAFLHFVAPGDQVPRTEVVPLFVGTVGAAFVHDFFNGLNANPFLSATSLASSFSPTLVGANGVAPTWSLVQTTNAPWSLLNSQSLHALVAQFNSFVAGVASPPEVDLLTAAVAQAQIQGPPDLRQRAIDAGQALLNQQVSSFQVDNSTVTLTSQRSELPITIVSAAHYPMTVLVHLVSNAFTFTKGSIFPLTLSTPTTVVRVPLRHAAGSEATLQVIITTPAGDVVLAHTAIPVRVTGASVVGYLLSIFSLVVLGVWWWRTSRRSNSPRRAK